MKGTTYVHPSFLAGVTLAGYEQDDGTIRSTSGITLSAWPEELTFEEKTFTLETVVPCGSGPKGKFVNAEYC